MVKNDIIQYGIIYLEWYFHQLTNSLLSRGEKKKKAFFKEKKKINREKHTKQITNDDILFFN